MLLASTYREKQKELKILYQHEDASKIEKLTAALFGKLLDMPIFVASSGFQYGGDAGPAGTQNRNFRLECKKYRDTTSHNRRELLGEIDHAIARDPSLEAWILITTRSVGEELSDDLIKKGENVGLPVLILDWKDDYLSPLAGLSATYPEIVEVEISEDASFLAQKLQIISTNQVEQILKNLQSWCLGYATLKNKSHEILKEIWNSPRESNAVLGQNVAGGAQDKKVKRETVDASISEWWNGVAKKDAPAVIMGLEGVGKTWATLDWLFCNKEEQPICLIISSAEAATLSTLSKNAVKKFIAEHLYEITGVRNSTFWLGRLNFLLKRPNKEGPVLTVFFDGLNQEPSIDWIRLLKILQGEAFAGRIRTIISTRKNHFENKLSNLRGLIIPPKTISVDVYNKISGGELDQMLAFEKLTRDELNPNLIELACIPRLFNLVVHFRTRLIDTGQVTIHRLLWEYGRDTFGERAGRSFSEGDWRAWLQEVAHAHIEGIKEFSTKLMGEMASRPDLSKCEVYARLSDIIDGHFVQSRRNGEFYFSPTVVAHALGAALLTHLDTFDESNFDILDAELSKWLDPISGFDQRSEILRAAVSILIEREDITTSSKAGVLVTGWLQSQNIDESHRIELANLANLLCHALLDAFEHSKNRANSSARLWAINALRSIPRTDDVALELIINRATSFYRLVSRGLRSFDKNKEIEKRRSEKFVQRIGKDVSGKTTVLGIEIEIVDNNDEVLQSNVLSILEGFPLSKAIPIFELASVSLAVTSDTGIVWDKLKWLCLLNKTDPVESTNALNKLAESFLHKTPEKGVDPDLPQRAAALVYWLTGREKDEFKAKSVNPDTYKLFTYEKDYLPKPSQSFFFPLERRHADITLSDKDVSLGARIQRTKELWLDPDFNPPQEFISDVREISGQINMEKIDRSQNRSIEDYNFEKIEPVIARCAPDLLSNLFRKKIESFSSCLSASRYWKALHATDCFLIAKEDESKYAKKLRLSNKEAEDGHECFAATQLLMLELLDLDFQTQIDIIIKADLKYISNDFGVVLHPPISEDVEALIVKYANGTLKQKNDLILLLSFYPVKLNDPSWLWLQNLSKKNECAHRGIIFEILTCSNPSRFGQFLLNEDWCWDPEIDFEVNHYGTEAIIEATLDQKFECVVSRIAPWQILKAARIRGADHTEVRIASKIFTYALSVKMDPPDVGSILSVDKSKAERFPLTYSVSPLENNEDENENDPFIALKHAMDTEAQLEAYRRANETAASRIIEARKSGANLYLMNLNSEDFVPVHIYAPDIIENWLDGLEELTLDFQRRVTLAESAFVSLCEVLLEHNPVQGAKLWRALYKTTRINYIGPANINDLLHLLFRVPDSNEISALRKEMLDLPNCNTDMDLLEISIVASYNNKSDWLIKVIESDERSDLVWKRKRGIVLKGFITDNSLPINEAWPEGEIRTSHEELQYRSARFQWRDACARYWLRSYLKSNAPDEAFAAWVLFVRAADNRVWVWLKKEIESENKNDLFFKRKIGHIKINNSKLEKFMKKQTNKLNDHFLNRKISNGIGPWIR